MRNPSARPRPNGTPSPWLTGCATALFSLSLLLGASGCRGTRKITDPVLVIETQGGTELGVSTDYGIVFTGATAERGDALFEAYFGDGPSAERSVIEPVAGGLYTARVDITFPSVPISFREPAEGELLELVGRRGRRRWSENTRVRRDPRVEGLILEIPAGFPDDPDQVGAGVYRRTKKFERELVGLVTGKIQLERDGALRKYLAVAGPSQLWRLAAHRRDGMRRKPFVYRDDIL